MSISRVTLSLVALSVAGLGLTVAAQQKPAAAAAPKVTVYKTSSCGCCRLWVDYMKQNGFDVQAMDVSSADVRAVSKAAGLKDEDARATPRRSATTSSRATCPRTTSSGC
jgi:hypothetical protein